MKSYKDKDILITGGAGTIGSALVNELVKFKPKRIRVLDINENSQYSLKTSLNDKKVRYIIGDIRDKQRVDLATKGVDIVFHCGALKHVPSCEYNPIETVLTNVIGLNNVIHSSKENKVKRFVYISTDKAVYPKNIMGVSKLLGEMFVNNACIGETKTIFSTVRFGNILNSNGSVVPLWRKQMLKREIEITNPNMTRFFITIKQAVNLILNVGCCGRDGETYIFKMRSVKLEDLANAVIGDDFIKKKIIGLRPGEKMFELLMTEEEAKYVEERKNVFVFQRQLITPHYTKLNKPKEPINKEKYDSREAKKFSLKELKNILELEKGYQGGK